MKGICQLCYEEKELQEKCHVYPSFVIKKTGHRFHYTKQGGKFGTKQDFYAKNAFCRVCEIVFNKWGEKPVADSFRFPQPIEAVPYKALEHLALSVLYRASLCRRDQLQHDDSTALECWRKKILIRESVEACHPIFCIPTFECPSHPIASVLNKTFNIAIVEEGDFRLVWLNMPGFLMTGFLNLPRPSPANELEQVIDRTAKSQAFRLSDEAKKLTLKVKV